MMIERESLVKDIDDKVYALLPNYSALGGSEFMKGLSDGVIKKVMGWI